MAKIRVKIIGYYEPNPEHYPEGYDIEQMAALDKSNVQNDGIAAICISDEDTIEVSVEAWGDEQ